MQLLENKLEKSSLWSGLVKFLRFGLIVSNILVVAATFSAVVARAFNISLLGYEEILIICAWWLYMFGSAYGSYEKSHIKADLLVSALKEGIFKDLIAILRNTLSVVLGVVFIIWAYQLFQWSAINGQLTPVWKIPIVISQSSLLFGLSVGVFFNVVYLYNEIKRFYFKRIKKVEYIDKML